MLSRTLSRFRKTAAAAAREHILHEAEETFSNFQVRSTASGGKLVGMSSRTSHWENEKRIGSELGVFGAEMDSRGKLLRGGEIILKNEKADFRGFDDPRVILKSLNLAVPEEVDTLNFQVSSKPLDVEYVVNKLK